MTLLAPTWLWGLAALAVPVAIHLLSRGHRRRVEVGSVRLMESRPGRTARRIRLTQPWRLALRLAALAAIVLALADPRVWTEPDDVAAADGPAVTWLLVDPELEDPPPGLRESRPELFGYLEDARDRATEVRLLAAGLPTPDDPGPREPGDHWSLVAEADLAAPPGAAMEVVSFDRSAALVGRRPTLSREVRWTAVGDPRPNRWLDGAVAVAGEVSVRIASSDSTGTSLETRRIPAGGGGDPALEIEGGDEALFLRLRDGGSIAADDALDLAPEAGRPTIAIVAPGEARADGRERVHDAAIALGSALLVPPRIVTDADLPGLAFAVVLGPDAGPIPPRIPRLAIGAEDAAACRERFPVPTEAGPLPLVVTRCPEPGNQDPASVLWRLPGGGELLSLESSDPATLRLATRAEPGWSDLGTGPVLPHLLLDLTLLRTDSEAPTAHLEISDRRASPPGEVDPRSGERTPLPEPLGWPRHAAWLLAFALLVTDRMGAPR